MMTPITVTAPERWSWSARRLGIASATGVFAVGILYVAVIVLWLIIEATPREPIGDPYLAVMEVLTMVSALALLGLVIGFWCFAHDARRVQALTALAVGSLAAGLTMAVHFVQLTAIRQLWRTGHLAEYRLVWPSALFAVEYATSGYQLQLKGLPPDRGNQFPAYCGATDGKWQVLAVSLSSDLAMPPPASR